MPTSAKILKICFGAVAILSIVGLVYVAPFLLDLGSRDSAGHYRQGNVYLAAHEYPRAISSYRKALIRDRTNRDALINMAYAVTQTKRYAKAAALYERASDLSGNDELLQVSAAVNYEYALMYEKARALFDQAAKTFRSSPVVALETVKFYIRQRLWREAGQAALDATRRFPGSAEAISLLAIVRLHEDRLQEAYALCQKAVALDPGNKQASALLGRLEKMKRQSAKDAWFFSEQEEREFNETVRSLMKETTTLTKQ